ncbi:virion structural protein [Vibrio phage USC-1]|uniref:Virion structural protein n=2 Tax=Aphroditevirus USC1 TaxID=2846605 RepID=A0A514A2E3_9CAUD|nr:virion structural protein [Vibrio phage USC-1]QCW23285.1 hypothetical protein [Vibrio phage 5 TSL-2019]QDH47443.1 hypothetical protein [Vibrio phage USC-1]
MKQTRGNTRVDLTELRKSLSRVPKPLEAILNVRVSETRSEGTGTEEEQLRRVEGRKLKSLGDIIANTINANVDLKKITPYITKAEVIWKTLILHPNGATKNILEYDSNNSEFKNTKLHDSLLRVLSEYYTNDYKIERELPNMVSDLLIGSGSYVKLNITRPALDNIINGNQIVEGNESFTKQQYRESVEKEINNVFKQATLNDKPAMLAKNIGFVKNPKAVDDKVTGMEAIWNDGSGEDDYEFPIIDERFGITVTDNVSVLAVQNMRHRIKERLNGIQGNESIQSYVTNRMAKTDVLNSADKEKKKKTKQPNPGAKTANLGLAQQEALQQVMPGDRSYATKAAQSLRAPRVYSQAPWGTPLGYHLPSDCFIPVHVHGDVNRLRGGYALLDENGEFLKMSKDYRFYQSLTAQANKIDDKPTGTSTNSLIANLRKVQSGGECDFDMSEFAMIAKSQIEKELYQAVWSGSDGSDVSIDLEEDVLKLFLERAFQQQRTRVLYIPECYFTYMAFQYNRLGIGESLTTQAKDFIARLAALDVADALAQLDNAQTRNELVVALEAQDTDPDLTISMARYEFFKSNPTVHNLISSGTLSMPMIVDALKEQSLLIRVEAGDNKFVTAPQMQVNQIDRTSFKRVDEDSRQYLLSSIANTYGLPRSWLDERDENGNNFQIEALAEQETLCNQTIMYQTQLAEMLTDIIRKNALVNEPVMNRLVDTILDSPEKLLVPDSKVKIEGDKQEKVMVILNDFLQNFFVSLPRPTTMESVTKIKEKMELAEEWSEKVVSMSAAKGLMGPLLERLNIDSEKLSPDELESQFAAVIRYRAFKLFNVPTPFDDIMNKGKEGGMFSLLNELDYFNENVGNFIIEYMKQFDDRVERLAKALPKPEGSEFTGDENSDPLEIGDTGEEQTDESLEDTDESADFESEELDGTEEPEETEETEETDEPAEEEESEETEELEDDEGLEEPEE